MLIIKVSGDILSVMRVNCKKRVYDGDTKMSSSEVKEQGGLD
jgi:hypothetical protein